jgi:hypothetical protein
MLLYSARIPPLHVCNAVGVARRRHPEVYFSRVDLLTSNHTASLTDVMLTSITRQVRSPSLKLWPRPEHVGRCLCRDNGMSALKIGTSANSVAILTGSKGTRCHVPGRLIEGMLGLTTIFLLDHFRTRN